MEVKEFVLNYFIKKTNKDKEDILCDISYFDEGYIDSLGVFELISILEEQFDFEFEDDDFQNRDFVTIHGISKIIEDKLNAL
jgi:acyl carrier protein